jgi:hypothetical protein
MINTCYDQRSLQPRERNVLVKKSKSYNRSRLLANYSTVEIMHTYIESYCDVCAKHLVDHLSLNDRHLPDALATPTLLNPMLGNKKRVIGSGLMSEGQYFKAQHYLLHKMQGGLDKNNPLLYYV